MVFAIFSAAGWQTSFSPLRRKEQRSIRKADDRQQQDGERAAHNDSSVVELAEKRLGSFGVKSHRDVIRNQ